MVAATTRQVDFTAQYNAGNAIDDRHFESEFDNVISTLDELLVTVASAPSSIGKGNTRVWVDPEAGIDPIVYIGDQDGDARDILTTIKSDLVNLSGTVATGGYKISDGNTNVTVSGNSIKMENNAVRGFTLDDNGVLTLPEQSAVRAYQNTSAQTVSSSTHTLVTLPSEDYDEKDEFDNTATNYKFTAKTKGKYTITGSIHYNGTSVDAGDRFLLYLKKNGVDTGDYSGDIVGAQSDVELCVATTIELDVDDYIQLYTWHSNSGTRTVEDAVFSIIKGA